ncbi:unnamed protein product [Laminaria digitata]
MLVVTVRRVAVNRGAKFLWWGVAGIPLYGGGEEGRGAFSRHYVSQPCEEATPDFSTNHKCPFKNIDQWESWGLAHCVVISTARAREGQPRIRVSDGMGVMIALCRSEFFFYHLCWRFIAYGSENRTVST